MKTDTSAVNAIAQSRHLLRRKSCEATTLTLLDSTAIAGNLRYPLAALGVALIGLLSACGGGSSTGASTQPVMVAAPPVATFSEKGSIVDSTSTGVANALIVASIGSQNYSTTSKSDGSFELLLPKDAPYPKFFEATVTKEGNLPGAILFSYVDSQITMLSPSNVVSAVKTSADMILPNLTNIFHIGDGAFSGMANSQLQVAQTGTSQESLFDLSADQLTKYTALRISYYGRGIQTGTDLNCKDYVALIDLDVNGAATSSSHSVHVVPPASPTDGSFSKSYVDFPLTGFVAGKFKVGFFSGSCDGDASDLDDLEVVASTGLLM